MSQSFPLTTMEEFLYWEDRPAYPWSCFARLRLAGRLDRTAFEAAIRMAVARHPMLAARIETAGRRRLRWTPVDDPRPDIKWEESAPGGPLPPALHQDLHREIGVRFHIRAAESASEVIVQIHHVCSDGIGSCTFIRDLLLAYAVACGGDAPLPELDPGRLAGRGKFGLTLGKFLRMAPQQMVGILGARQFLMRKPAPIVPYQAEPNDGPPPRNYPATVHSVLDRATTARLRRTAQQSGVTLNDLLARDLFLALVEWRAAQNQAPDGRWLRMMIPMNLRSAGDRFLPAANVVSSVFLDRRGSDLADPDRLLHGVHEEMELIKRLRLGYTFIFSTEICRRLPGGLEKQIRADKCSISCILTNLGSPFAKMPLPHSEGCLKVGNVTLEDVEFVAPVRPYCCATFTVAFYAHKLGITLHYDPRPLTERQAADLQEMYLRRLQASQSGA